MLAETKAYINKNIVDCNIAIDEDKIQKIGKEASMPKAETKISLKKLLVLPGLIDAHVHLRDEGKAYKEDFFTGTAAAAAGGVTTVLDMPNNNPVTMSAETLRKRMEIARSKILVNVGFYSEFPEGLEEIKNIVKAGALSFKLYMSEKIGGLNIDDDKTLPEAFRIVKDLNAPVAVHAEDKNTIEQAKTKLKEANLNSIEAFLEAHSERAEEKAVKRLLTIAQKSGARIHFCHISTKNGIKEIVENKKLGLPVTCETTPHHLLLAVNDLKKIGTIALTMPPIREKKNITALWSGIKNKWIDIIGSDHAPHTLEEKTNENVWNVKTGIPGLETTLPLLLTEIAKKRQLTLTDLVRLCCEKPAEIFNLKERGGIKEGNYADLIAVDLHRKHKINASMFHSKAKFSPFDGWNVVGKPVKTFVNGQLIMDKGEIVANAGCGKIIKRG